MSEIMQTIVVAGLYVVALAAALLGLVVGVINICKLIGGKL